MENEKAIDFESYDIIEEPTCSTKLIKVKEDDVNKSTKKLREEECSLPVKSDSSTFNPTSSIIDLSSCVIKGANRHLFENGLFEVVQMRDQTPYLKQSGGIVAQCRICLTKIKGSLGVSSNFISHLRNRHPEDYITYEKKKKDKQQIYEIDTSVTYNRNDVYVISEMENVGRIGFETCDVAEESTYSSAFLKFEEDSVDTNFEQLNEVSLEKSASLGESDASTSIDLDPSELKGANRLLFVNSFFEVVEKRDETPYLKKEGGIVAQCLHCSAKIKGSLGVSSNFISHLRQQHPPEYAKYEELKKKKQNPKYIKHKEQKKERCNISKMHACFDNRVLSFLVSMHAPLSVVDNPTFIKLFKGTDLKLKSSKMMLELLKDKHCKAMTAIHKVLDEIPYCCTAAHIWSSGPISFFGYSCHWIDEDTFQRKSAALACRQFSGSQENVEDIMNNIHIQFGLNNNKILFTIIDNDSDVCKAFNGYRTAAENVMDMKIKTEIAVDEVENTAFLGLNELPKRFQSASHTLNLLAITDFPNIIKKNENIFFQHQEAFERCFNLWNICCFPKPAKIIENILCCTLKTPIVRRWDSLFDSVKDLLLHKDKLSALSTELSICELTPSNFGYLENYITLMTPVASALDFLQSDDKMYFGYFIATIVSLKVKMIRIQTIDELGDLANVCSELINCLVERFKTVFQIDAGAEDLIVAAIACPNIKLKFIPVLQQTAQEMRMENIKQMFIRHAKRIFRTSNLNYRDVDEDVCRELELYLADSDNSFLCFQRYPIIRKVFLKYNTPIPSTAAPMGRLFPFDDMANNPPSKNLYDENFEQLVLLRANNF